VENGCKKVSETTASGVVERAVEATVNEVVNGIIERVVEIDMESHNRPSAFKHKQKIRAKKVDGEKVSNSRFS
jgi:hypothetical protein